MSRESCILLMGVGLLEGWPGRPLDLCEIACSRGFKSVPHVQCKYRCICRSAISDSISFLSNLPSDKEGRLQPSKFGLHRSLITTINPN